MFVLSRQIVYVKPPSGSGYCHIADERGKMSEFASYGTPKSPQIKELCGDHCLRRKGRGGVVTVLIAKHVYAIGVTSLPSACVSFSLSWIYSYPGRSTVP
ncbi:hypothetical protein KM043_009546 [Ampulex compressa]|nr:hypothetical protein KM043_009546 [Ampulex compressa]